MSIQITNQPLEAGVNECKFNLLVQVKPNREGECEVITNVEGAWIDGGWIAHQVKPLTKTTIPLWGKNKKFLSSKAVHKEHEGFYVLTHMMYYRQTRTNELNICQTLYNHEWDNEYTITLQQEFFKDERLVNHLW